MRWRRRGWRWDPAVDGRLTPPASTLPRGEWGPQAPRAVAWGRVPRPTTRAQTHHAQGARAAAASAVAASPCLDRGGWRRTVRPLCGEGRRRPRPARRSPRSRPTRCSPSGRSSGRGWGGSSSGRPT